MLPCALMHYIYILNQNMCRYAQNKTSILIYTCQDNQRLRLISQVGRNLRKWCNPNQTHEIYRLFILGNHSLSKNKLFPS